MEHNNYSDFMVKVKKEGKKIICFGAGMMMHYAEDLFIELGLSNAIEIFVDNDTSKWGKKKPLFGREILITSIEHIQKLKTEDYIILITCERYQSIVKQITNDVNLNKMEYYIYPELNFLYFKENVELSDLIKRKEMIIPPIIHYCWFGGKEKPPFVESCINSWKKYCPGYEIIEWNESNYDFSKIKYTHEAYKEKKWAYVSDVARLEAIYKYGGIYFDTDVELIHTIDELRTFDGFVVYGEWPAPNSGAGIGATKGNEIIRQMIGIRQESSFYMDGGKIDDKTNSIYEADVLRRFNFKLNMQYENKMNFALLPVDIIAPCSKNGNQKYITYRTLGKHYCINSWRER